jgi:hypothetical protein
VRKLALPADTDGYSATSGAGSLIVFNDGPTGRLRPDYEGAAWRVGLSWLLDAEEYQYLRAFYRTAILSGSEPFTIDLLIRDGTTNEYMARFIPGSMELASVSGDSFSVRAMAEAGPTPYPFTETVFNLLEQLVNVIMPANMGEVA